MYDSQYWSAFEPDSGGFLPGGGLFDWFIEGEAKLKLLTADDDEYLRFAGGSSGFGSFESDFLDQDRLRTIIGKHCN